jgi:hypothetical protein
MKSKSEEEEKLSLMPVDAEMIGRQPNQRLLIAV